MKRTRRIIRTRNEHRSSVPIPTVGASQAFREQVNSRAVTHDGHSLDTVRFLDTDRTTPNPSENISPGVKFSSDFVVFRLIPLD